VESEKAPQGRDALPEATTERARQGGVGQELADDRGQGAAIAGSDTFQDRELSLFRDWTRNALGAETVALKTARNVFRPVFKIAKNTDALGSLPSEESQEEPHLLVRRELPCFTYDAQGFCYLFLDMNFAGIVGNVPCQGFGLDRDFRTSENRSPLP
jgi:hypothetical protein